MLNILKLEMPLRLKKFLFRKANMKKTYGLEITDLFGGHISEMENGDILAAISLSKNRIVSAKKGKIPLSSNNNENGALFQSYSSRRCQCN
jgi:hypothetical protein